MEDETLYNSPELQFDHDTHTYTVGGVVVPSVTQILKIFSDFSRVDPEYLVEKADLGEKVHQTCELFDKGTLNESLLHPLLAEYLGSWKKFLADTGFKPVEIETAYAHKQYYYAGRIDRVGVCDNSHVLLDIKTGIYHKTHALQTAGYALLYNQGKTKKEQIKRRWTVYISPSGYKIDIHSSEADERIFLAALTIHNYNNKSKTNEVKP